jgi:hypothetical protein
MASNIILPAFHIRNNILYNISPLLATEICKMAKMRRKTSYAAGKMLANGKMCDIMTIQ